MEGMKYIRLTQGKHAIVDDDLYEWLNQWNWYYKKATSGEGGYACRNEYMPKHITVRMHVVVNQTPAGMATDHINGNKLDNRRANLRSANRVQNGFNQAVRRNNTTGFKGITWHKRDQHYRVQIRVGDKRIIRGFKELNDAVAFRDETYKKYHKEFARGSD